MKKFIILGNVNAVTYREVFQLIKDYELWLGTRTMSGRMWFPTQRGMETRHDKYMDGVRMTQIACCWYTNLSHGKRDQRMDFRKLWPRDASEYQKYDNYDAINVNKTCDIPEGYEGVMGVPITFLDRFCPGQFEIVGFRKGDDGEDLRVGGQCPYTRILIRFKK